LAILLLKIEGKSLINRNEVVTDILSEQRSLRCLRQEK
jgi:hypothetical protein